MGKNRTTRTSLNKKKGKVHSRSARHSQLVKSKRASVESVRGRALFTPNAGLGSKLPSSKKGVKKHLRREAHLLREQAEARNKAEPAAAGAMSM